MSMSKMSFIENLHLSSNIAAVLSTVDYDKLKNAILADDKPFFLSLKGIGEKTAEKIVTTGANVLEKDKRVRFNIPHYAVPMYSFSNMLDPVQKDMLARAVAAASPDEMISILHELLRSVRSENGPVRAYDEPEYSSLPVSQLSNLIGIEPNTKTDKLCLFNFYLNPLDVVPKDMLNSLSRRQRGAVNAAFEELKRQIVNRAVMFGFIAPSGQLNRFFVCSSGQLKKESGYWMDDETFNTHKRAFSGGLNATKINLNTGFKPVLKKDAHGELITEWVDGKGIPMTKILQARALLTSAAVPASSVLGKPFRLRNLICIGEFEKNMTANVMSVSDEYKVTEGVRSDIANNFADGYVMFFKDRLGDIVAQIRGGMEIKGCGASFDYVQFCMDRGYDKNEDCYLIKDVDGVVHDLQKETDIYGIVNTTVFKGFKKYGSWQNYVACMEKYGLDEIYFCAVEEQVDEHVEPETKRLSRQMVQSLFALTDDEIEYIISDTVFKCNSYEDLNTAVEIMGETNRDYDRRSNLGKLVSVYPDMLAEPSVQKTLRDLHLKQYNSLMCGQLDINGLYRFVIPDPCAIADVIFGRKPVDDPSIGWLKSGECFCDLYATAEQLCLLRSPHAFMEWVVANVAKPCPYVASGAVYTSVHDLFYRVLQMDYDGDHLLVIDDPTLCRIASRIRKSFDIPVLYYEPSVAKNPGPMPTGKEEFARKICECIEKCAEYNKVGQYSNYVTAAWSTYRPDMSHEELRALLIKIAIIAASINHAVDAQKTYSLNKLEDCMESITKEFGRKPNSERFRRATPSKPNDDPRWNKELLAPGKGVVDRMGAIASLYVNKKLKLDTSSLHFDWRMLKHPDERFNKQVDQAICSEELIRSIEALCRTNNENDLCIIAKMKRGERVGFAEFFSLLKFLNSAFFSKYKEQEDDIVDIKCTHRMRVEILRRITVDFVRTSRSAKDMTEDDLLMFAATAALRMTFSARKYQTGDYDLRHFIFDTFGDLYAECVMLNVAANCNQAQEEQELDSHPDFCDFPSVNEPDFAFYPDSYDVPPMDFGMFDAMLYNELGDLC